MNKKMNLLFCSVFMTAAAFAAVKMDPVFTSNMMLQQEKPITFFGTGDKGTTVKVDFDGRSVSAKVDDKGEWKAVFPAMKAGTKTYQAAVSDGKTNLNLQNILIGDVWVCAGQSNMEMPVGKKFTRGWSAQNCDKEVAAANYPLIRYADQKNIISHNILQPAVLLRGGWEVCSPAVADHFSATAYFFARQLHKDLNIPIGLINLTWSGTRIEPWISYEGYQAAKLESDLKVIKTYTMTPEQKKAYVAKETARYQKQIADYQAKLDKRFAKEKAACAVYAKADFNDSKWQKAGLQHNQFTIIRWYRTNFTLANDAKGKTLTLRSIWGPIARASDIYLNGNKIYSVPAGAPDAKQVLQLQLKPEQLNQNGKNILAIRAVFYYNWGDRGRMNNLINGIKLFNGKKTYNVGPWKSCNEVVFDWQKNKIALPSAIYIPYSGPQFQSNLYNGMVNAWTKLPVKGVIWYQGCSNAGQLHYLPLHKAMIADWRTKWKQPDMPFLIVQLAGFGDGKWQKTQPGTPSYAITRDIQMQLTKDPKVGLACAIDIGEATNIHPANKQEVGRRLALEAERIAYGKDIVSRGPIFKSAEPVYPCWENFLYYASCTLYTRKPTNKMRVTFINAEAGLKTNDGKKVGAFAIAGADKKFVWADAVIDGDTVIVSSPAVKEPKYVRYAFVMYRGDCNLCSRNGLPVYPFRSDVFDYSKVK